MTKTLADIPQDERGACVGMWCDVHVAGQVLTEIIGAEPESNGLVTLIDPNGGRAYQLEKLPMHAITPRFDLPRAWQADGAPPADNRTVVADALRAYGSALRNYWGDIDGRREKAKLHRFSELLATNHQEVSLNRALDILGIVHSDEYGYIWEDWEES